MRILVDADGCPVVDIVLRCAKEADVPVLLVCDNAHRMERPGAETLVVDRGADSADLALVNRVQAGDVVVTQDYGLAALCLAKHAVVLHQDGYPYTDDTIDSMLMARHTARKVRRAGGRLRGPAPRTRQQDEAFSRCLREILADCGRR